MDYDSENIGNELYKVEVLNNIPIMPGGMFSMMSYRKRCELCNRDHKDNCEFGGDDDRRTTLG